MHIIVLDKNIPEIDANAELQLRSSNGSIALLPLLSLDIDCAPKSVNDTMKFHEQSVAQCFHEPAIVGLDSGDPNIVRVGPKLRARPLFVDFAETAVTDDICDQDGGETTFHASSQCP
ncbi:hypothetical protein GCM10010924_42420 [Rhizobium wenxiniae]|nr:hypothetical protein GCM10010924_42420 [Rhizobium wenxiniae]